MTTKRRETYQMLCVGVMIGNIVSLLFYKSVPDCVRCATVAVCAMLLAIWLEIAKPGRR